MPSPWANAGAARNSSRKRGEDRASRAKPARNDPPTFFHVHTSARVLHRQSQCEGKSTLPIRAAGRSRNALVRRHARLTPDESRPLRLDATQQQRSSRVNFPLSTYSVLGKKNVSQEKENIFEGLQKGCVHCPQNQDKLDRASPLPNLDFKTTGNSSVTNHCARRRSLASRRLSLWRTAFDEDPLKSANSFPLVPSNLKSIKRFNSESVSRPFVTHRWRKWRNSACRSKDSSPYENDRKSRRRNDSAAQPSHSRGSPTRRSGVLQRVKWRKRSATAVSGVRRNAEIAGES